MADFIFLIYDISDKKSFDECKKYYRERIKELCKKDIKIMLIGNKKDLGYSHKISFEEANKFANLNKYIYMETSCLKNKNVYETFEKAIEITLNERKILIENGNKKSGLKINKKKMDVF